MKKIIVAAMTVALVLALSACGSEKTLVISSSFVREASELERYQENIFDPFEEEHGVKIEFNVISETGGLYQKIESEQTSGNVTSDLLIAHYSDMVNYIVNNDYMEPLNDLEDEMGRDFAENFDGSTNKDGNRYFFPINVDVYLSIARKEAFDHLPNGLTKEDILAGNYTWEDYVDWADGTNVKTAIKGQSVKLLIYQVGGMALSNTTTIEGTFPMINNEPNQIAWEQILEMKQNDAIHSESLTLASLDGLLKDNSIQLAFEHLATVGLTYESAPEQFEVFPGPQGTSGKAGSIAGGHGIGIVKGSENQELAEEFIKWMTAEEQMVHAALGSIPPQAAASDLSGEEGLVIKMGYDTLANANVEGLQMIPEYSDWGLVKGASDVVFAAIMNGDVNTVAELHTLLDQQQAVLDGLKTS